MLQFIKITRFHIFSLGWLYPLFPKFQEIGDVYLQDLISTLQNWKHQMFKRNIHD